MIFQKLIFFKVYHLNNMMKLLLQEQDQLERQQQEENECSRTTSTENKKNNSNWSDRDISTDSISKQVRQQDGFSNKFKPPSSSSDNRNEVLTRLGPCMEFVIERQILDILSTLCQADIPPGLRPHVIRVFIFFMTHVKQTILPYVGVYLPIRFNFRSFLLFYVFNLTPEVINIDFYHHNLICPLYLHLESAGIVSRRIMRRKMKFFSLVSLCFMMTKRNLSL